MGILGPGLTDGVHKNKSMNSTPLWIYLVSQFLNFQSFAKPVVKQSTGELEDTAMEDLALRSVENAPNMVEVVCGDKSYLLPVGWEVSILRQSLRSAHGREDVEESGFEGL